MKKFLPVVISCLLFTLKAFSFTQIVTVQNYVFTPASFTVNSGDTIEWVWLNGSHTTTSLDIPVGAAAWNHSINSSNKTFIYTPIIGGVYNYKCTPHQANGMVGKFTVKGCKPVSAQISASSATKFCMGGSVLLTSIVSANVTSFQWKKGETNISGATNSTFSATELGSYTLMVAIKCGNTATSNAINVTVYNLPAATITPAGIVNLCKGDSVKLQASTASGVTFQWVKNDADISGATADNYTTKKAGKYKVIVTRSSTECSKTSAVTEVKIVTCLNSVTDSQTTEKTIKIFPNPASQDFHISLPSYNNEQYTLAIYDGNARLISNIKITSKDFSFGSDLKQGIYIVQVKKNKAVIFEKKIVKNK